MEQRINEANVERQESQETPFVTQSTRQPPIQSSQNEINERENREAELKAELQNRQTQIENMKLDMLQREKIEQQAMSEMAKRIENNRPEQKNSFNEISENAVENSMDRSVLSNTKLSTSISSEGEKEIAKKVEEMTRKLVVKPPEINMNPSNSIVKRSFSDLYQDKTIVDQIKFVTNRVKPNLSARVPDTIRTLDNYCQRFGYLSMGEVVDAPGKYFLGRRITNGKEGKIQYVVPNFEKTIFIETPDVGKNLCHFANRTVSKWNEYSKAEGELEVYVNTVKQTPLEDYEEMTVRKCSHGTTIYKILATLFYFYIEQKENILNLSAIETKELIAIILSVQRSLEDVYESLTAFLSTVNQNKLVKFIINAKNEVKLALIASTGTQNEGLIDTFIVDPNAYLDPSMMKNPRRETPKWVEKFSGEKSFANLFTTQKWEPVSDYMKPDNYFNF